MIWLKALCKNWDHFWFSPLPIYNVSLFRFLLGLTLLGLYGYRFTEFELFYFNSGLLPVDQATRILPPGYTSALPFYLATDIGIFWQGLLHLFLLCGFTLGIFARSLTWLLFVVHVGLMQRNMSIIYGADLFTSYWLFYLSFIKHNQSFSVWNWLNKSRRNVIESDLLSTVGMRLIQIQICITYAYTGLEKLKGVTWWEGSAVWHLLAMIEIVPHDFSYIRNFPLLVGALTTGALVFEIYFIFAVWNKKLRYPWLLTGFVFHFFTAVFIDLWFFFLVMVLSYLLFLPDLREAKKRLLSILSKRLAKQLNS